jgi:NAD+ kinase
MTVSAPTPPRPFTVGVVVHPTKPIADSVERLTRWVRAQGGVIVARDKDRDRVGGTIPTVSDEEFVADVDAVVSLGGDGTMLGAMRLVAAKPVPVLGVNYGNLGFLLEIGPADLDWALPRIVNGDFRVEPHLGLRVEGCNGSTPTNEPVVAFNDVVLTRRRAHGPVSLDLRVNEEQYGYYRCDALIVATPTGSTAYNYSAGGPVISPSAPAIVITPVAPMAGISRAVVLGPDDDVALHVDAKGLRVDVDIDGVTVGGLQPDQHVILHAAAEAAQVVRLDAGRYGQRSRVRRGLLNLPVRPDQLRELIPAHLRERAH